MSETINLPKGPRAPRALQGIAFLASRHKTMAHLRRKYGSSYTLNIPIFGRAVVISDPALVKQLFMTSTEVAKNVEPNLGRVLGPGSFFSLEGEAHRRQRKLLVPPFHGKRMRSYEGIIEEETLREAASWPIGTEFETLEPMMRITLNAILRAVFGAEGAEFESLRALLPTMVTNASRLVVLPVPELNLGSRTPWARHAAYRAQFDGIVDTLIAKAKADPNLADRDDVLAIMLQSSYDDGSMMSNNAVADQLLTMLAAGHETTATTMAWAVERLRRHPAILRRLVEEVDAGGSELLQATILELQRHRPVIDLTMRHVAAESMPLGEWVIPKGYNVIVGVSLVHNDEKTFPNAQTFDPDRFIGTAPDSYSWVPFGGGTRRCIGAAFANMEMMVVLRTLLRDFELVPTLEPAERWHSRGVAFAPHKGGRALVRRRARVAERVREAELTG
ncbi:cytochrome P450 [Jatrophihabitans sp.]|uniref:cytochrome P450 n=1 Tax=Jatrophihabitans sp. TaxID=1932789 RepID=UPI0030C75A59|nr:cytochrome monooxygenase [Jatrophihabitans sp.]